MKIDYGEALEIEVFRITGKYQNSAKCFEKVIEKYPYSFLIIRQFRI